MNHPLCGYYTPVVNIIINYCYFLAMKLCETSFGGYYAPNMNNMNTMNLYYQLSLSGYYALICNKHVQSKTHWLLCHELYFFYFGLVVFLWSPSPPHLLSHVVNFFFCKCSNLVYYCQTRFLAFMVP